VVCMKSPSSIGSGHHAFKLGKGELFLSHKQIQPFHTKALIKVRYIHSRTQGGGTQPSARKTYFGSVTLTVPIGKTSIDLPQNLFLMRASVMVVTIISVLAVWIDGQTDRQTEDR